MVLTILYDFSIYYWITTGGIIIINGNLYGFECEYYDGMTEKRFPSILNHVIFVDTGKKPSIEEIKYQLMNQEPLISDEEAFERHLIRKWKNEEMDE